MVEIDGYISKGSGIITKAGGMINKASSLLNSVFGWFQALSGFEKLLLISMAGLGIYTYMKYIELSKANHQRRRPIEI